MIIKKFGDDSSCYKWFERYALFQWRISEVIRDVIYQIDWVWWFFQSIHKFITNTWICLRNHQKIKHIPYRFPKKWISHEENNKSSSANPRIRWSHELWLIFCSPISEKKNRNPDCLEPSKRQLSHLCGPQCWSLSHGKMESRWVNDFSPATCYVYAYIMCMHICICMCILWFHVDILRENGWSRSMVQNKTLVPSWVCSPLPNKTTGNSTHRETVKALQFFRRKS